MKMVTRKNEQKVEKNLYSMLPFIWESEQQT